MPRSAKQPPVPIFHVRGLAVILDADLAALYGTSTKALNQAARRHATRFPADFRFQLTKDEWGALRDQVRQRSPQPADPQRLAILKSQFVTASSATHGGRRTCPWAFTEHGALMASNVLNTEEAVKMSVFIVRAFVKQREALAANQAILCRLAEIDQKLLLHDSALRDLYQKLLPLLQPPPELPKRRIGFQP